MKILNIFLVFLFSQSVFCQDDEEFKKNSFYYDLLGHTRSIFSLNYEKTVYSFNNYLHLDIRTGIGFEGAYKIEGEKYNSRKTIPSAVVFLVGKKHILLI